MLVIKIVVILYFQLMSAIFAMPTYSRHPGPSEPQKRPDLAFFSAFRAPPRITAPTFNLTFNLTTLTITTPRT